MKLPSVLRKTEGVAVCITNTSILPTPGMTVEYLLVTKEDIKDRKENSVHNRTRLNGIIEMPPLQPQRSFGFKTKTLPVKLQTATSRVRQHGRPPMKEHGVAGVWIRITYQEKIVHQLMLPKTLSTHIRWN